MSIAFENVLWIAGTAILGYATAAIFAGKLKLRRNLFLTIYIPLFAILFYVFSQRNGINILNEFSRNWIWGIVGAIIAGAIVIKNVLSQPSYPRKHGTGFLVDILWPGFSYGLIDGLYLSVLPVLAIRQILVNQSWSFGPIGQIGAGVIALTASIFVTILYHIGYPEFRGRRVLWAVLGNGVLSMAYIVTLNPVAAVAPHIAMHIASVVHGRETTVQLPPHYETKKRAA